MTVEVIRRFPQTAIPFPLGGEVVNRIFARAIVEGTTPSQLIDGQTQVMQFENPSALQYLNVLAQRFEGIAQEGEKAKEGFNIGRSLLYLMLTDKSQEGIVPELSYDFVDDYAIRESERLERVYGDDEETLVNGAEWEHTVRLNMFRLLEKGVYDNMDRNLKTNGTLFQNSIFIGFVYSYFLFREGLSDPANYAPNYPT
ncbi:MAG: hypothetical protein HYT06_01970 [Candidatus Levybacteria bacterium]|nr:hypothetical protein [Candidatus Levybacteria bacterium]